jgi:cell division protein FtsB
MSFLFRQLAYVAAFVLVGLYVFTMLKGPQGVPAMLERRQELLKTERENEALRKQIEEQKRYLEQLAEDPATRERVVREKTGKQKPNETTIIYDEEQKGSTSERH